MNNGCCDADIFNWLPTGDILLGSVAPGQSTTVNLPSGGNIRAIDGGGSFSNLIFDESFTVPNGCGPFTFTIDPTFCAEVSCPDDIEVTCLDSTEPSNTGFATGNCGDPAPTFSDDVSGSCPEIITRTWTYTAGSETQTCVQVITCLLYTSPSPRDRG